MLCVVDKSVGRSHFSQITRYKVLRSLYRNSSDLFRSDVMWLLLL